ncbi:MAG: DUF2769 domain-containing protein [Methanobacteriaceae archaeon]|nr:DUF2769 domain-containing protein [Methanobacteriaceae archaeon]
MVKIDFNKANMDKCLCYKCKVQKNSSCVKDKVILLNERVLGLDVDISWALDPDEFPGLYCTSGKTSCKDVEFHEECICPECDLWKENDLASALPKGSFCADGPSSSCELGQCKPLSKDIGEKILRKYYTPF